MGKREKLIQKIFKGKADVSPNEAIKILEMLDFVATNWRFTPHFLKTTPSIRYNRSYPKPVKIVPIGKITRSAKK